MTQLSYELIDMVLIKHNNLQLAIIFWRMYIAKKLVNENTSIEKAILNGNLKLVKFLHHIGLYIFNYCQIRHTHNKKIKRYLHSIAELSSNIDHVYIPINIWSMISTGYIY
jgi:hypothetical protein